MDVGAGRTDRPRVEEPPPDAVVGLVDCAENEESSSSGSLAAVAEDEDATEASTNFSLRSWDLIYIV